MATRTPALATSRDRQHERRLVGERLLRTLVLAGLDPDALPRAASLIVALDAIAREDREARLEQAREFGRRGAAERWRRAT